MDDLTPAEQKRADVFLWLYEHGHLNDFAGRGVDGRQRPGAHPPDPDICCRATIRPSARHTPDAVRGRA